MIDLAGKTVLLTGASRGIGAATARVLDRCGARVVMSYGSNRSMAETVASECSHDPVLLQADLGDEAAADELFAAAIEAVGRIDVLVNNAAIAPEADPGATDGAWADAWRTTMQVNVFALADLCRQAILHFEANGGGAIINVASRAAIRGDDPNMMHYAASKGAVAALTRSIARGYGKQDILAYTLAPGWVATDMATGFFAANPDALDSFPLGEAAPPDEIANTIAFLASGLARHLTGSTLDINGATHVR